VQQIDRVESLIEDTLLVSDESSCNRPVDILSVLKQAAERVTADSKTKVWCLFPTAGSLYVSGNEMRLWRALYNLLLNASEAAREASIVVVAVFFDDSPNRIRIDVHDTGPGISPDIQDKIFSCYFTTKRSHVGLGLSLAKEIIENHRGTISVRSDIRNGTIFTVRLPLAGVARVSKTPSL
ncbi:MAG: ATP-binding protein, partial [Terriglobia bacterium]